MRIEILDQAAEDLIEGFHFYEDQQVGLGTYFLNTLYSDIESLRIYGGIHRKAYKGFHRLLSKRFPFAVFYTVQEDAVYVRAVVDCRRNPAWIRKRLS
jgi:hypothetical protein